MARISHLIVDGLAFVLIGVGLTVTYLGVERKLPTPAMQQEKQVAGWSEPAMTGAIANKRLDAPSKPIAAQPKPTAEVMSPIPSTVRAWFDPPWH
ncbi:hypothetical protein [Methylobacterium sp. J-070]|uniref:hypothetical protein n=1 Tax=Methylobacterium sp. J-070 TaxID=2836650 RepID=UPI001FB896C2|nr:hypothetical protein [Methylobacterium sp. J-070]MCJ2052862.1 hypothetical protein [Methylobacterium sp. J-070]